MAYAEWPSSVPFRPERSAWGYVPGREALATEMKGGDSRQRRRPGDGVGTARWGRGCTAAQMTGFTAFLGTIGGGATRFLMPISLDGHTYETRVVQIIGGAGGIQYGSIGAETMVSFSVLVFPAEMSIVTGALDGFGLYAAFGTARLLTSYEGPLLRVRRSSDNAQFDFGALGRWLDVAAIRAFVGSASGFVTTWYDQSGNGHHGTQAVAANQGRIVNAGVPDVGPGGAPAIVFDGANDEYVLTNALGFGRNVAGVTVAAVADPINAGTGYVVSAYGTNDLRAGLVWQGPNSRFYGVGARLDGGTATSFPGAVSSASAGYNRLIARHRYQDGQGDLVTNGVLATTAGWQAAGLSSNTDLRLDPRVGGNGGGFQFAGALSCAVLANTALDITSLDAALAQVSP